MNWSSTAESGSAELFPDGDNPKTNISFINDKNGTSSLIMIILIVIGVLSGGVLIAGGIILGVLVKKLRESSNDVQNSNVYAPETLYREVPSESLTDLSSICEHATVHIYETVT
jgi:hypothetical protein